MAHPPSDDAPLDGDSSLEHASQVLFRRARDGSQSVWNLISDRYYKKLVLLARAGLSERARRVAAADAEDLVQVALFRFFAKVRSYQGDGKGCIHNRLVQELRRVLAEAGRRGGAGGRAVHERGEGDAALVRLATAEESPSRTAQVREALERLDAALHHPEMTEGNRRLLEAVDLGDGDPQDLAAAEGVPYETYRKRLQRARNAWRSLSGLDPESELA